MLSVKHLRRDGLEPVDFDLPDGEALAVLGPSGAGKSLLLRALADLDPNQGEVDLDGQRRESVSAPLWRRAVTYLGPQIGWWSEQVSVHFRAADREAAAALFERLRLSPKAMDWPVQRLSTGEAQRIGLARLLVQEPKVMLLDEPTSALDETATEAAEALLRERLEAGCAMVFTTHDKTQARRLARSALLVAPGGRVTEGQP